MEAYQKSVLEYDDIVGALDFERRQSEKRGIAIGEKRGVAIGEERKEKEIYAKVTPFFVNMGMSVEDIAKLTGLPIEQVRIFLQNRD
jgi:predicted transposase YdaD